MSFESFVSGDGYSCYNGDCISVMEDLISDGVKVDLVLTDPPYGTTACKWDTVIDLDSMWSCLDGIKRDVHTPIVLFGSEPFSSNLRMSNIGQFRYDWIWYKNTASGFPFAKFQPLRNHEIISVFYEKRPFYNPIKEERDATLESKKRMTYKYNGNHKSEVYDLNSVEHSLGDKCYPKTVKRFKSVPNSKGRLHPSQKPVDLLEYLVRTYTNEGDVVLDFCMGSGSTGVACLNLNRRFIGVELDSGYFDVACGRFRDCCVQSTLDF